MDRKTATLLISLFFISAGAVLKAQCPPSDSVDHITYEYFNQPDILRRLYLRLQSCPDQQADLTKVIHQFGSAYYNREPSQLDSATYYGRLAVEKRVALGGLVLPEDLAKSHLYLGIYYKAANRFQEALEALEKAEGLYADLAEPDFLALTLLEAARVNKELGDYQRVKELLALSLGYARKAGDAETEANCMFERGNLRNNLSRFQEAVKDFTVAQGIFENLNEEGYYYGEIFNTQLSKAVALYGLGQKQEAEREYRAVIAGYRSIGDFSNLVTTYNNLGYNLIGEGRLEEAKKLLEEARSIATERKDKRNLANNADHFGEYYLSKGLPEEAAQQFQLAQTHLLPTYKPSSLYKIPTEEQLKNTDIPTDLFIFLGDQARALGAITTKGSNEAKGEKAKIIDAQLALYRAGDFVLDELRNQHNGQATKLFWREKALPFYESAIRLAHQQGKAEAAFFFFEKSKAILLHEALVGSDASKTLPKELSQKESDLARTLTKAKATLSTAEDPTVALQEIVSTRTQLEKLRAELRQNYPSYRAMTERLVVPDADAFYQSLLAPARQTLVHYFTGPKHTFALVLDQGGVHTTDLGPSDSLRQITTQMLAYFTASADIQNDPAGYAAAASAAYNAFIRPLHLRPRQALLVIPDGPLTYLPFPALLTEASSASRLGDLPYLIRQHPITYGHSASILSRKRPLLEGNAEIVAFAPFTDGTALLDYPTLPFSQDELSTVSTDFEVRLFKDGNATLAAFRSANTSAKILHLSTHAFSSAQEQSPLIAFHDQPLLLRDLYHESLSADLVILSACQTNVGKLAQGEGVLGLGRGFIQAGANSIIASLWNVNARGSGQVLGNFYQQLSTGKTKGISLHEAQLNYLNDEALRDLDKSPYLWAGLTYYGAEGKLAPTPVSFLKPWHWAALFGFSTLAGLILWSRSRSKN